MAELSSPMDLPRIEAAVREILIAVGEDPERDGLLDTPGRVARAYVEAFAGLHADPAEVLSKRFAVDHQELVIVRDIAMYSTCEHHLLPFHGKAHIGYLPRNGYVTGLSKLARLVDVFARQIADALVEHLDVLGVIVVIEAEHLCMSMRGVRKPGASTITSAVRGILARNATTRAEAMALLGFGPR